MRGLEAEDALAAWGAHMTTDQYFDAQLAATGSAEIAERLARERAAAKLRAGEHTE